ncbi:MAG: hypothetical protein K0U41_06420 [Gammaproteobacteria bacterium]|nr:hypothetical protein [Gammaproteobacteria bacterium]
MTTTHLSASAKVGDNKISFETTSHEDGKYYTLVITDKGKTYDFGIPFTNLEAVTNVINMGIEEFHNRPENKGT